MEKPNLLFRFMKVISVEKQDDHFIVKFRDYCKRDPIFTMTDQELNEEFRHGNMSVDNRIGFNSAIESAEKAL